MKTHQSCSRYWKCFFSDRIQSIPWSRTLFTLEILPRNWRNLMADAVSYFFQNMSICFTYFIFQTYPKMTVTNFKSGECRGQTQHLITWLQHLIPWLCKFPCNVLKNRSVISTVGDNRLELLLIRYVAGKCISHFIRDVTACLDSGTLSNSICF